MDAAVCTCKWIYLCSSSPSAWDRSALLIDLNDRATLHLFGPHKWRCVVGLGALSGANRDSGEKINLSRRTAWTVGIVRNALTPSKRGSLTPNPGMNPGGSYFGGQDGDIKG